MSNEKFNMFSTIGPSMRAVKTTCGQLGSASTVVEMSWAD